MTTRETVIPAALWSLYLLAPASFCHLHRWLSVSGQYSFSILHEGKLKWESICGCVQLVCHFTTMSKTNIIIVHLCSFAPYPSPSVFWLLSWWLPFLVLVDCCQVTATNTHSQHACTHAQNSHKTDARSNTHTHTRTQYTHTSVVHKCLHCHSVFFISSELVSRASCTEEKVEDVTNAHRHIEWTNSPGSLACCPWQHRHLHVHLCSQCLTCLTKC